MGRFLTLVLGLAVAFTLPFAIWGEGMEVLATVARLESLGDWAWLVGLGLLVGDLILPTPSTVVMSALGYVYGVVVGGFLASAGAVGSASLGYGLCRWMGEPLAVKLAGKRGLEKGVALFERWGPWLVALSRWLPIMAEVVACLGGMTRMPWRRFVAAAACGSLPLGFAFAWVGHLGNEFPRIAFAVSALGPPLLWYLIGRRWLNHPADGRPGR